MNSGVRILLSLCGDGDLFPLSQPGGYFGVRWHAPVFAGREADRSRLWSFRYAVSFELITEEPGNGYM